QWQDGGDGSSYETYDVPGYVLTTKDGTVYNITRDPPGGVVSDYMYEDLAHQFTPSQFLRVRPYPGRPKLTSIVLRTQDKIIISPTSIYHQNPTNGVTRTIWIQRDPDSNRIIAIRDPIAGANGVPAVKYVYNEDT